MSRGIKYSEEFKKNALRIKLISMTALLLLLSLIIKPS